MQQDSVPQMSGYKEFKTYRRSNSEVFMFINIIQFEILWPLEIAEDTYKEEETLSGSSSLSH